MYAKPVSIIFNRLSYSLNEHSISDQSYSFTNDGSDDEVVVLNHTEQPQTMRSSSSFTYFFFNLYVYSSGKLYSDSLKLLCDVFFVH